MLPTFEEAYRSSLLQADYKEINIIHEYNTILNKRVSSQILKLKQKHFELGDKPEKLLVSQFKGVQLSRAIHRINSKSGTNPKQINTCFRDFYKELYSSKVKPAKTDFYKFFTNLNILKLDSVSKDDTDSAISKDDLMKAIQAFPSGKAAGLVGFGCKL